MCIADKLQFNFFRENQRKLANISILFVPHIVFVEMKPYPSKKRGRIMNYAC